MLKLGDSSNPLLAVEQDVDTDEGTTEDGTGNSELAVGFGLGGATDDGGFGGEETLGERRAGELAEDRGTDGGEVARGLGERLHGGGAPDGIEKNRLHGVV